MNSLPEDSNDSYKLAFKESRDIFFSFMSLCIFCKLSFSRGAEGARTHLFGAMLDDIIQSAGGILTLSQEGVHNSCNRELRYMIELAIKLATVSQNYSNQEAEKQVKHMRR